MNVTERDFLAQKEYYRDQMRAAQRYQQAKQVADPSSQPSYARALTWLGGHLANWGESLQERYGTLVTPTLPQPR